MKKKLDNTLDFTPLPVVVISTYNEDGTHLHKPYMRLSLMSIR